MVQDHFEDQESVCLFGFSRPRGSLFGEFQTVRFSDENPVLLMSTEINLTFLFTLLPVVVAFVFVVFILYRARREAFFRERETAFRLSISELEMKVLRSQINPHFIFNCLNSIQHVMNRTNTATASDYLIKFSRLIRHVLEVSYERMIPLSDEIAALKLYMELEQLRTNGSFTFEFNIDSDINPDELYVPPLFIQPLVENSVWHGMGNRTSGGLINLSIEKSDSMVKWTIKDNGNNPGAKREPYDLAHFVKRSSRGISLINGRLEIINRVYGTQAEFKVETSRDGINEGTVVTLTLPYEN